MIEPLKPKMLVRHVCICFICQSKKQKASTKRLSRRIWRRKLKEQMQRSTKCIEE